MALARKCDRCGKLYEHYPKGNKIEFNGFRLTFKKAHNTDYIDSQDGVRDLCPDCMKQLNKWMIGGKFDEYLPKLVRDKIPDIIRANGQGCEIEILSDEDYIKALDAKLDKEVAEYHESHSMEELADLLECVYASAVAMRGSDGIDELYAAYWEKNAERGGFWKRILLKEIKEKKD